MKHTLIDLATILPPDLAQSPTAKQHVLDAVMGQPVRSYEHVAELVYRVWADTDEGLRMARRAAEAAGRTLAVA